VRRGALLFPLALSVAPGCTDFVAVPAAQVRTVTDLGRVRLHTPRQSIELEEARSFGAQVEGRALGPVRLEDGVTVLDAQNDRIAVRRDVLIRAIEQETSRGARTGGAALGVAVTASGVLAGMFFLVLVLAIE